MVHSVLEQLDSLDVRDLKRVEEALRDLNTKYRTDRVMDIHHLASLSSPQSDEEKELPPEAIFLKNTLPDIYKFLLNFKTSLKFQIFEEASEEKSKTAGSDARLKPEGQEAQERTGIKRDSLLTGNADELAVLISSLLRQSGRRSIPQEMKQKLDLINEIVGLALGGMGELIYVATFCSERLKVTDDYVRDERGEIDQAEQKYFDAVAAKLIEIDAEHPERHVTLNAVFHEKALEIFSVAPLGQLQRVIGGYEEETVATLRKLLGQSDLSECLVSSKALSPESLSRETPAAPRPLAPMQEIIESIDNDKNNRQKLRKADSSLRDLVDKCRFFVNSQKILENKPLDKNEEKHIINGYEKWETKALRKLLAKAGLKELTYEYKMDAKGKRVKTFKSMAEMIELIESDPNRVVARALEGSTKFKRKVEAAVHKYSLFLSAKDKCGRGESERLNAPERVMLLEAHTRVRGKFTQKHRGNIFQIIGHYLAAFLTLPANLTRTREAHSHLSKSEQMLKKQENAIGRFQTLGFFTAKRLPLGPRPVSQPVVLEQQQPKGKEEKPAIPVTPPSRRSFRGGNGG